MRGKKKLLYSHKIIQLGLRKCQGTLSVIPDVSAARSSLQKKHIARLNTYPLLSYSVKFGRHCQEALVLLWMQSFVICDRLSQR